MGLKTGFFKRKEFECKCGCGFDTVDAELLILLEMIRIRYNSPVIIHSGCRCLEYNRKVGSKDTSQHTKGRAADISVKNVSHDEVQHYLKTMYPDEYGIGCYDNFTHIDSRTKGPARW